LSVVCRDTKVRLEIPAAQMNRAVPRKLILTESCKDPGLFVQEPSVLRKRLLKINFGVAGLVRKEPPMKASWNEAQAILVRGIGPAS